MVFNFGEWVVKVAVNGVKADAFTREWASLQLANYFVREKITEADITRFDEELTAYEEQIEAEKALAEKMINGKDEY